MCYFEMFIFERLKTCLLFQFVKRINELTAINGFNILLPLVFH